MQLERALWRKLKVDQMSGCVPRDSRVVRGSEQTCLLPLFLMVQPLWGAFLLQRDGCTEAQKWACGYQLFLCAAQSQVACFPKGLGSTCTHSYPSFEKPALPKPSQESTEKRSHGIAMGLGLSQSFTEDTPGSVSPKIASPEGADPRMAGSSSGRML